MGKLNTVTEEILQKAKEALSAAVTKKDHPFRYFTLATTGINQSPRMRTVVLREFSTDWTLSIYTDKRSRKVTHVRENNRVCMLFFDPSALWQLRIDALAWLETDEKKITRAWNAVQESSRKDYITKLEPGTRIKGPDEVEYLSGDHHFAMMHFKPTKMEYLQLKRPNHLRVFFSLEEHNSWVGSFMVP